LRSKKEIRCRQAGRRVPGTLSAVETRLAGGIEPFQCSEVLPTMSKASFDFAQDAIEFPRDGFNLA
jgi:hypothetical protein